MGCVIKAESRTVEFAFLQEAEYSDEVLEYYDQPPAIRLEYPAPSGRIQRPWHTADYFLLRHDGAGWDECKPARELQRLALHQPHRYRLGEDGHWHCPPGEAYATALGLSYRVRSSDQINWNAQANWLYLEDYYRHLNDLSVVDEVCGALLAAVAARPGISLADLRGAVSGATVDDIHTLIVRGDVYVDLNSHRVAEAQRAPIFSSRAVAYGYDVSSPPQCAGAGTPSGSLALPTDSHAVTLAVGARVVWDGAVWRIVNVGEREIALLPCDSHALPEIGDQSVAQVADLLSVTRPAFETLVCTGRVVGDDLRQGRTGVTAEGRDLLARASEKALTEATQHAHLLRLHRRRKEALTPDESQALARIPRRTLRAWDAQWRLAEATYGSGFVGLLSQRSRCGRGAQIPRDVVMLIESVLKEYYDTPTNRLRRGAYGEVLLRCAEIRLAPPSERTFYTYAQRHLPAYAQALLRSGPRGAYPNKEQYLAGERTVPRQGEHAWALAYIDHTELDLELIESDTGKRLGKAWLTLLVGGSTRKILAHALSFDRPSATSCMLVVRDCVRRHHRLPQTLVVDGGAEFRSVYFEALLARYEVTKRLRPPHEPRYGAVLERLFGATNTQFIYHLLGNTQLTHRKRQVTKSTDPKTHACWTLPALAKRVEEWAYTVYEGIEHPALGQSPADAYARSLDQHGARSHQLIPYDQDFLLATLVSTRTGSARVQPGRGVQINYLLYWCDAMRDPSVEGVSVPVRYDPLDVTVAYAYVRGVWRRCITAYAAEFSGCSARELALLTAEFRRRQQLVHRRATVEVTQKQLAIFRRANMQVERVLLQRRRDRELRAVVVANDAGWGPSHVPVPSDAYRTSAGEDTGAEAADGCSTAAATPLEMLTGADGPGHARHGRRGRSGTPTLMAPLTASGARGNGSAAPEPDEDVLHYFGRYLG
jgi:transposase InsO family protein